MFIQLRQPIRIRLLRPARHRRQHLRIPPIQTRHRRLLPRPRIYTVLPGGAAPIPLLNDGRPARPADCSHSYGAGLYWVCIHIFTPSRTNPLLLHPPQILLLPLRRILKAVVTLPHMVLRLPQLFDLLRIFDDHYGSVILVFKRTVLAILLVVGRGLAFFGDGLEGGAGGGENFC